MMTNTTGQYRIHGANRNVGKQQYDSMTELLTALDKIATRNPKEYIAVTLPPLQTFSGHAHKVASKVRDAA